MSSPSPTRARLVGLRRAFHRYPETAWTEFWTTARIVEELRAIGVDELLIGAEVLDSELRMSVPDEPTLAAAHTRAADRGVDPALLEACAGGHTGCVGVLTRGEGPTVGSVLTSMRCHSASRPMRTMRRPRTASPPSEQA
jgi:Metal-dependent amidase/aminoacylase/carboxypeptidase